MSFCRTRRIDVGVAPGLAALEAHRLAAIEGSKGLESGL